MATRDNGSGGTNPRIRTAISSINDTMGGATPVPGVEDTRVNAAELASELLKLASGGGGGSRLSKTARNSLLALLMLVIGPGGVFAAYYALKDDVKHLQEHAEQPMHDAAVEEFRLIKVRMIKVEDGLSDIAAGQKTISEGIESLKAEKVEALERERDALADELRRRRRRDRDR